jgi:hypothetical protein
VEGVAQVIRGGLSVEVRPEQSHQPLPVQSVLVCQGEQFQQACGLFEAPGTPFETPRPNRDREAAEHVDAHGLWLTGEASLLLELCFPKITLTYTSFDSTQREVRTEPL